MFVFNGKFTGRVLIVGANESDLLGSVRINFPADLNSSVYVRAKNDNDLISNIFVKYRGIDDLPSSVHPALSVDLPSQVSVRPHNRMTGLVEVVEPPIVKAELSPVEDTYVREGMPKLNYGRDGDQFVGTDWGGDKYRTLMRFNTSTIPANKRIKKATLVLNLLNSRPAIPIGIYEVPDGEQWTEYGVTWDSQPSQGNLLKTFDSGTYAGKTEVDITTYINDLYEGRKTHNGFLLKALAEGTLGSYKQYGTRETADQALRPVIIVEYYDPTIYSYKREDLKGSVFVFARNQSELLSSVVVAGYVDKNDLEGSVLVRDPFAPVSGELPSSVAVNRDTLPSSVWVPARSHIDSSVSVRNQTSDQGLEGTVIVNKDYLPSSVFVRPYADLPSSVHVKSFVDDDLSSSVIVNAPEREGSVFVRFYKDLEGSVVVRSTDDKDLASSVVVNKPDLPSSVTVRNYEDLDSTVVSRASGDGDLESSVFVRSEYLKGLVWVRNTLDIDIESSLIVRETESEELPATVIPRVPRDSDLDSSVFVRREVDIDLPSTVVPRVIGVSDIPSYLEIEIASNLPSSVEVRGLYNHDLPSSVGVREDELIDIDGSVIVRFGGYHDLEGSVIPRVYGDADLNGSVIIMMTGNTDLPSSVNPRVYGVNDLPSTVEVSGDYDFGYVFIM